MSKWINLLRGKREKNKRAVNPPMSVLSTPYGEIFAKNNRILEPKIHNPYFQPMSALSGASEGISINFNGIKNIVKNAYTPTDKTDNGRFTK